MNLVLLGKVGLTFLKLSLLAVGGANAVIPEVRRAVVVQSHWMTDETFTHLFAIAQSAPGPNVMIVSLIGWRLVGLAGLLLATVAMLGPSCLLAFAVGRVWSRWSMAPVVGMLQQVLAPIAVGLIAASGLILARAADQTVAAGAITALVAGFVLFTRRNPMWALAAAAVGAILLRRIGLPL
jgi:chromate transporter